MFEAWCLGPVRIPKNKTSSLRPLTFFKLSILELAHVSGREYMQLGVGGGGGGTFIMDSTGMCLQVWVPFLTKNSLIEV